MDVRKQMKVKTVTEDKSEITVVTTGAKYVFDKSGKQGRISCHQQLNQKRLLATIEFNCPLSTLSVEYHDDATCLLHQEVERGGFLRVQINSDSLLDLYCSSALDLVFSGNFLSDYSAQKDGHILLIDESGGIGIYPYRGLKSVELSNLADEGWQINYTLEPWGRFLVSVFPPRPFNYARSLEERIAHHGSIGPWVPPPYPPDEMIAEASKYTNILVLHEMIWQGKRTRAGQPVTTLDELYEDVSWCCFDYVPVNEEELTRVIKKGHSVGMKVIPYMSPMFSMAKGKDFLDRVENALEEYGFDGVYFDGISMDILYSYELIRAARARLGDRLLYLHCTSDPLDSRNVYCPFINTYADFVLRAEHDADSDDKYLRYAISGFNTSNTVNYICYYPYSLDFIRELIDKALAVKARFYLGLPETEKEKLLKEEYFPKLDKECSPGS